MGSYPTAATNNVAWHFERDLTSIDAWRAQQTLCIAHQNKDFIYDGTGSVTGIACEHDLYGSTQPASVRTQFAEVGDGPVARARSFRKALAVWQA